MIDCILKYKDLIAAFAGIGTFIYAIIALYTLREVKKQRLSMYKPELFLKSFCIIPTFNPLSNKNREELLEYKLTNYNDYSESTNKAEPNISPLYKLENIGFGVAKDVKCEWEFDYKKAINKIQEYISDDYELYFQSFFYGIRKKNDDEFHRSATILEKGETQNIDYIPPIHIANHHHKHVIPSIILFSHIYYLIFKHNLIAQTYSRFDGEDYVDFPKVKLKLTYKDVNNKVYKKKYCLSISAISPTIEEPLNTDNELCIFYCLCEEYK